MKFTIAIPAYKRTFLKECIDSILSQTYTDFELVIVNDASPEDLDSVVECYDDSRIRYYVNEANCGALNVVDNWNICLSYAQGEYLILMGDDDKLLPYCLEEYVKLMEKYPRLGLYHGWTEIIDEKSKFYSVQSPWPEYESAYSLLWNRWNGRQLFIGDFLFEVSMLRQNGGFYKLPLAWCSDDISAVIAARKNGMANTQRIVFQYRVNPLTISSTGNAAIKMEAIKGEKMWCENFLEEVPENELDRKYRLLCRRDMCKCFLKKYIYTVAEDLSQSPFIRIWFWLRMRNSYGLSFKMVAYAFIEAVKTKKTKKLKERAYVH